MLLKGYHPVLWELYQYCGELKRATIGTFEDTMSTFRRYHEYITGYTVLRGIPSVTWRDNTQYYGKHQNCGEILSILQGLPSVLWKETAITVEDGHTTEEGNPKHCGGNTQSACGFTLRPLFIAHSHDEIFMRFFIQRSHDEAEARRSIVASNINQNTE